MNENVKSDNVKQEHKDLILKAIAYHFSDAKVILFGSRGTNRPGSDIDVALDIGEPIRSHA